MNDVSVGKAIYIEIDADSADTALATVEVMCRKLLANPVTEDFEVSVVDEMELTSS